MHQRIASDPEAWFSTEANSTVRQRVVLQKEGSEGMKIELSSQRCGRAVRSHSVTGQPNPFNRFQEAAMSDPGGDSEAQRGTFVVTLKGRRFALIMASSTRPLGELLDQFIELFGDIPSLQ
jgi:hypothetical protein